MDTIIAFGLACALGCAWWLTFQALNNEREEHGEELTKLKQQHAYEMDQTTAAQQLEVRQLNERHAEALQSAKCSGWYEGVKYQHDLMKPKRDKAGRFA